MPAVMGAGLAHDGDRRFTDENLLGPHAASVAGSSTPNRKSLAKISMLTAAFPRSDPTGHHTAGCRAE